MNQGGFQGFLQRACVSDEVDHQDYPNDLGFFVTQIPQTFAAISAAWLWQVRRRSRYLWECMVYSCVLTANALFVTLRFVAGAQESFKAWAVSDVILYPMGSLLTLLSTWCFLRLLWKRVASIDRHGRGLKCILGLMVLSATADVVRWVCLHYRRSRKNLHYAGLGEQDYHIQWEIVQAVAYWIDKCTRFPAITWCISILASPLREFRKASAALGPQVQYHMRWALREGRLQCFGAFICFLAQVLDELAFLWLELLRESSHWQRRGSGYRAVVFKISSFALNVSLQAVGALLLSGALTTMEYDRRQTPAVEADDQDAQTVEDVYHQKVVELARRGITVQQLLEFYRFLKSPCSCISASIS